MINHRSAEVRVKPHHHYGFKEAKCGEPGKIKLPRKESNFSLEELLFNVHTTLHLKSDMPDWQQFPLNLLIDKVKYTYMCYPFETLVIFSIVSSAENRKSLLCRNRIVNKKVKNKDILLTLAHTKLLNVPL